jgi:hypothetical protein
VKDFPAGNSSSSTSRMAFLRSLCSLPKFKSMVDLIQPMVSILLFQCFLLINFRNFSQSRRKSPASIRLGLLGAAKKHFSLHLSMTPNRLSNCYHLLQRTLETNPFSQMERSTSLCSSWGLFSEKYHVRCKLNQERSLIFLSIW